MLRRASTLLSWFGAASALALAVLALASPRIRYNLTSGAVQAMEVASRSIKGLQTSMQSRLERERAALEEMSGTADSATTQWESSMTVSKVASALADEPRLRGQTVVVRIIGGIIHLEGEVRSEDDKSLAGEIARRASGAEVIANNLKVTSRVS